MTGCDLPFAPAALYLFMSIYRGASYFSFMDVPGIIALADTLESETAALGDGLESCAFYHEFLNESSLYVGEQSGSWYTLFAVLIGILLSKHFN